MGHDTGIKHDNGKLRYDLLPFEAIEEIVKIYTFGSEKYESNSWQGVDKERYFSALMRHLVAHRKGEKIDSESGELHLAHVGWNVLALIWNELQEKDEEDWGDRLERATAHD